MFECFTLHGHLIASDLRATTEVGDGFRWTNTDNDKQNTLIPLIWISNGVHYCLSSIGQIAIIPNTIFKSGTWFSYEQYYLPIYYQKVINIIKSRTETHRPCSTHKLNVKRKCSLPNIKNIKQNQTYHLYNIINCAHSKLIIVWIFAVDVKAYYYKL